MALVFVTLAAPVAASAQDGSHTRHESRASAAHARQAFARGMAHVDREEWTEAEAAFREALAARPSAVIKYNLALVLARLGSVVEASALLESVALDDSAPERTRSSAVAERTRAEERVAVITLHATGEGLVALLDGLEVAVGQTHRVNPGPHLVQALRDGREVSRSEFVLGGGEHRTISADPLVTQPENETPRPGPVVPPLEPQSGPADRPAHRSVLRTWWFWTVVGVVAAGTATTVVLVTRDSGPSVPTATPGFEWRL